MANTPTQLGDKAGPQGSAAPKRSGLATASLVLGICGFCTAGLSGIVGFILGLVALQRIRSSGGALGGRGMAVAGVVLGAVSILLLLVVLIITPGMLVLCRNELRDWTKETWEKARQNGEKNESDYFSGHNQSSQGLGSLLNWTPGSARCLQRTAIEHGHKMTAGAAHHALLHQMGSTCRSSSAKSATFPRVIVRSSAVGTSRSASTSPPPP